MKGAIIMSDKAKEIQVELKNKAQDLGEEIKSKAAEGKEFIKQKYEEATAGVDEKVQEDSFKFADNVIEKIAGIAAREIKGILALKGNFISDFASGIVNSEEAVDPTRGVSVEVGEKNVVVDFKMIVEYGAPAPEIFKQLREHISQQIETMTGLHLAALHVEVIDVMTKEEFQKAAQSRFNSYQNEDMNYINRYQDGYPHHGQQMQPQNAYKRGNF